LDFYPDTIFAQALGWLPWYFAATVALLAVAWVRLLGKETAVSSS
jgi:hypothetical protein